MAPPQIVIDTNVLVAALRSKRGASFELLGLIDSGLFETNVSVPLVLEYDDACNRLTASTRLTAADIETVIDYVVAVANKRKVFYLWRPLLPDPKDDLVLEVAVASRSEFLVTFNKRDFGDAARFGIRVLTPNEFLNEIGAKS